MIALLWTQGRQWRNWITAHPFLLLLLALLEGLWGWMLWTLSELTNLSARLPLPFPFFGLLSTLLLNFPLIIMPRQLRGLKAEWILTQPVHPRTMVAFIWLNETYHWGVSLLAFFIAIPYRVLVGIPQALTLVCFVLIIVLNIVLGAALAMMEATGWRTELGWLGKVWKYWVRSIFVAFFGALLGLYCADAVVSAFLGQPISLTLMFIEHLRWIETPIGMIVLMPLMPTYHALKAKSADIEMLLGLGLLATLTTIMVWQASQVAMPFCEVAFLQGERWQRLTRVMAWDISTTAKFLTSVTWFGKGLAALLGLHWRYWQRTKSLVTASVSMVLVFFLARSRVLYLAPGSPNYFLLLAFVPALLHPLPYPEWLKSQPLPLNRVFLTLVLLRTVVVVPICLSILLAVVPTLPKSAVFIRSIAFTLAAIAFGVGMGAILQVQTVSLPMDPMDLQWFVYFLIAAPFAMAVSLTLGPLWFLGVLLSWILGVLLYEWARQKWHEQP